MEKEMLKHFLPKGLMEHFSITGIEEKAEESSNSTIIEISLEEINQIPQGYDSSQYESKGFFPSKLVQDFPIRGKAVYLSIKRRRWRNKSNPSEIIYNDYTLIAEGSKLTQELSDFLKGTGRDPRRYG
jgi:hypothetical protein